MKLHYKYETGVSVFVDLLELHFENNKLLDLLFNRHTYSKESSIRPQYRVLDLVWLVLLHTASAWVRFRFVQIFKGKNDALSLFLAVAMVCNGVCHVCK